MSNVIEKFFRDFLRIFLPELEAIVDLNQEYDFLDKELQKIEVPIKKGKKFVDKLVKIYLKNGEEKWILLHVEIQGQDGENFDERMFIYFYRLFDKYNVKIVALGVITYPTNDTFEYHYQFINTEVIYRYNVAKIEEMSEEYLLKSDNSFALVCLAVKYSNKSKNDKGLRFKFKRDLVKLMYELGRNRKEVVALFEFIDGMLRLNDLELEQKITETIEKIEEVKCMPYVTSVEEVGIEKGKKEGRKEGRKRW
ncbi:MAG: hypothetical protein V1872_03355 [bacterium]